MSQNSVGLSALQQNATFPAFFYPIYSTALLEAWALVNAGGILHLLAAITFLAFALAGYLHHKRTFPLKSPSRVHRNERQRPRIRMGPLDMVRFVLMLAGGYIFGALILFGYMTPMFIFAIGLQFLPWSRLCPTRRDFFTSGALVALGAALLLLVEAEVFRNPVHIPLAVLVLWAGALVAFLRRV